MNPNTKLLHSRVESSTARASVTPLFLASAFEAGSPFFYSRKNNPNVEEFEETVRILEGAAHAVAVTTGMAAVRLCFDLLRPGDTLVMNSAVYGCSYKLAQRLSYQFKIALHVVDLSNPRNMASIPPHANMVFFETPTNPWLRVINISEVAKHIKHHNPSGLVVVDNTWATPLNQRPLEHGADISLHSATKYFSGHSDVMGGVVLTHRDELAATLVANRFYSGFTLDPHSAWLLRRSMQTLSLRMERHRLVTAELVQFLQACPQVTQVYYPYIDGQQLLNYGGIIFIDLHPDLADKYTDFASNLQLFGTGTGMACVTSMVAQPYTGSHASMSDEEKAVMGLGRGLVRLCFGLEDVEDLKADLSSALNKIGPVLRQNSHRIAKSA